jgi:hypothetical protein
VRARPATAVGTSRWQSAAPSRAPDRRKVPDAKVICCVRNPAMILDSIESLIRRNAFELSGIFSYDSGGTVYSRVEALASAAGMFGFAYNALREAVYGGQSDLIVRYESLVANPLGTLAAIYGFIGEDLHPHDPKHIEPCYGRCHITVRRAREIYALRIFKPPRWPHATWSSPRRAAGGVFGLT